MGAGPKKRRPETTIIWWSESSCHSLRDASQCANSESASPPSYYRPQGAARRGGISRKRGKTGTIPGFGPRRYRPIGFSFQVCNRRLAKDCSSSQAGRARHMGVSRVWVGRVSKGNKRKASPRTSHSTNFSFFRKAANRGSCSTRLNRGSPMIWLTPAS
jgi:hypothetical protein